jgi:hypothetical protein
VLIDIAQIDMRRYRRKMKRLNIEIRLMRGRQRQADRDHGQRGVEWRGSELSPM